MVKRRSKIVIFICALMFLVLIAASYTYLFSTGSSQETTLKPGYGVVNNSQFQIESGWYQNFSTGYVKSAKLNYNGSTSKAVLMIMVDQFQDQSTYENSYLVLSQKNDWKVSSTNTENREGIQVKTIQVTRTGGGETVQYYFFQKNGKYYQILIDMTTSDPSQFFNNENYKLNQTVNTIIRTIT